MIKEGKQIPNSIAHSAMSYELNNLIKQLNRGLIENKKIYTDICKIDPKFNFQLYHPITHQGIDQMFLKPLILRQIDQLMEQKQILIKKKQILIFVKSQENNLKINEQVNNVHHFSFLRTAWTKYSIKQDNTTEKIDNLNKIIGLVRTNIKNVIENQQKSINKQIIAQYSKKSYNQSIYESRNRQEYERLKMRNQELQSKCLQLQEIIENKNVKIYTLQNQLVHVQNRIKQSIQTLNLTSEKLLLLKKCKNNLEAEIKRLQNNQNQHKFMLFRNIGEDFKVKIQSNCFAQIIIDETTKNIAEIIDFVKSKTQIKSTTNFDYSNPQLQIPSLNLNQTLTTNETTLTDRYFPKSSKFIPMRTQRSSLMKSQTLKQSSNISINVIQKRNAQLSEDINQKGLGYKRFSRKAQFPLTSDRFRKQRTKMDEQQIGRNQLNQILEKLQMR